MRRIIGTTVALLLLTFSLSPSAAAGEVDVLGVAVNGEGTVARVTEEKTAQLAQGKDLHGQVVATPMEYRVELACPVLNAPQTAARLPTSRWCKRSRR